MIEYKSYNIDDTLKFLNERKFSKVENIIRNDKLNIQLRHSVAERIKQIKPPRFYDIWRTLCYKSLLLTLELMEPPKRN